MKNSTNNHSQKSNNAVAPLLLDTSSIAFTVDHRCKHCNKLLGVEHLIMPALDIKCARCGHLNSILKEYDRQIIITDKNGVIMYVNEPVTVATGYSMDEIMGKTPALWGSQMTKEFYQKMWDQIAVQKKAIVTKVTNKHKSGKLYSVIMRISPILDTNGNVEFFIGMETIDNELDNHTDLVE
jgi:PAS domain S-box-containing protein